MWNGSIWSQQNQQSADAVGYYSFFTLPGSYKVMASLPDYGPYESPIWY